MTKATAATGPGGGAGDSNSPFPSIPLGLDLKPRQEIPPLTPEEKEKIETVFKRYNYDPVHLLAMLQDIQEMNNYIPRSWAEEIALRLAIPRTKIYRIATFFKSLSLVPRGRHICTVCVGTTCHVRGAQKLIDKVERDFNLKPGKTTEDMLLTLETVGCVGACALGPLVILDGKYHGHMDTDKLGKVLKGFKDKP